MKKLLLIIIIGLSLLLICSPSFRGGFVDELSLLFKITGRRMIARKARVEIGDKNGTFPITYYGDGSFEYLGVSDSLKSVTSLWYYCKYMDAINLSPGGSGAVQTLPDDNTSGGYQLDAATEYLYFNGGVCNNWDTLSDLEVKVRFELNAASSSNNDSVFFDLKCSYKGVGEDTTKYQLVTKGQLVENTPQYTMYTATILIDYDLVVNVVQKGDIFSFRLNLNTARSDIDDVIVNFGRFKYKTKVLQPTTY